MAEAVSTVMFLALLAGLGYIVWRVVRRRRGEDEPEGHPRVGVVTAACLAFVVIGTVTDPTQETTSEPTGHQRDRRAAEERERQEQDGQAARQQADREPAEAERRRRVEQGEIGLVTRVVDGDTVEIEGVGRVRLIGVDTPERGEECFDEATPYLRGRVGGQTVRYRHQSEREDRYDRQLLDLFRGGELVNLDIAQAGWGEELTIQPNDRYATRIAAAEQDARAVPRGRWAGCLEEPEPEPEPPREPSPPADDEDDDSGGGADRAARCRLAPALRSASPIFRSLPATRVTVTATASPARARRSSRSCSGAWSQPAVAGGKVETPRRLATGPLPPPRGGCPVHRL